MPINENLLPPSIVDLLTKYRKLERETNEKIMIRSRLETIQKAIEHELNRNK